MVRPSRGRATTCGLLALVALSLAAVLLAGCVKELTPGEVLVDPGSLYGKTVRVTGRVIGGGLEVAGINAYKIEGGGAELWVLSYKDAAPEDGLTVAVQGRVNESVTLGGVQIPAHVVEDEREVVQ